MLLINPIVTRIEGFYSTVRIPPSPWGGGGDHDFIHEIGPDVHIKATVPITSKRESTQKSKFLTT